LLSLEGVHLLEHVVTCYYLEFRDDKILD